jgi:hypothetical protein
MDILERIDATVNRARPTENERARRLLENPLIANHKEASLEDLSTSRREDPQL